MTEWTSESQLAIAEEKLYRHSYMYADEVMTPQIVAMINEHEHFKHYPLEVTKQGWNFKITLIGKDSYSY